MNSETNNTSYTWIFYSYTDSPRNTQPGKYLHIVGNGTYSDRRSNAHTLEANGTAWYAGDVYVGSTSGVNRDEGSKKLATEEQIVGKKTEGTVVIFEDKEYTCGTGAEVFNDLANNKAIGEYSHAEGNSTVAKGAYAHAEGGNTIASGIWSHAEGSGTTASQSYSHAEGQGAIASGVGSHAEGQFSEARGDYSHAMGGGAVAATQYSMAQGLFNIIDTEDGKAIYYPVTTGGIKTENLDKNTIVYKFVNHPELDLFTGEMLGEIESISVAELQKGDSFVFNQNSTKPYYVVSSISENPDDNTQMTLQHYLMTSYPVFNLGKYAHIVGNGGSVYTRSNAYTLDWDGNAWYAGSVECSSFILKSSTEGSNKRFRITIDDNGELHTAEIVE